MAKTFTLRIGADEFEVERQGSALLINGKRFVPEIDGDAVTVGGATHKVEIAQASAIVDGIAYAIETEGLEAKKSSPGGFQSGPQAGDGSVNAIMPGMIIKVLVNQGDEVSSGDVLVILEAMKMESEICSPLDGTVKDVCVEAGDNVAQNQPLVLIE